MGWTFYLDNPRLTRADMIARKFTQSPSEGNPWAFGFDMIAERGSTVYAIMWRENPSENTPRVFFGMVFLTQRHPGEFGFKDIGEDCGPTACAMPLRMLERLEAVAPEAHGYAKGWRDRVRAYHAARQARTHTQWAPGQCVRFSPLGDVFRLIAPAGPRRGWHVARVSDNAAFRAPAARFAHTEIVVPDPYP